MRTLSLITFVFVLMFFLAGCAPGPNSIEKTPDKEGKIAGFLMGIWHGLIAPITFIISIFSDNVSLYETHNNGNWYNFGFVLGAGLFLSGGIFGKGKSKKKKRC
ncbi:hypothetical protein ACFLRW_01135 [Acidobacteriota bacterium]